MGAGVIYVGFNNSAIGPGSAGNGKLVLGGMAAAANLSAQSLILASNDSSLGSGLYSAIGEVDLGMPGQMFSSIQLTGAGNALVVGDQGHGVFRQAYYFTSLQVSGAVIIGNQMGGNGDMEQTGGADTFSQTLTVSNQSGSVGLYHLDGASSSLKTVGFVLGAMQGSSGQFNMTGGQLTVTDPSNDVIGAAGGGVFTQSSGLSVFTGGLTISRDATSRGSFILGGTGQTQIGGPVVLGQAAGSKGVFNFNVMNGDQATMALLNGMAATFDVGVSGSGMVNIGGGTVWANDAVVSNFDGSVGAVVISGTGAAFRATTLELGNSSIGTGGKFVGGIGTLSIEQNGAASFDSKLQMYDPIVYDLNGNAVSSMGGVFVQSGASLEVGGHAGASSNTLLIDGGGVLAGSGSISSLGVSTVPVSLYGSATTTNYSLTVNLSPGGILEAKGGPLLVEGNFVGTGTAQIDGQSTLEIAGSVAAGVTVDFADGLTAPGTATLILDRPADFHGSISGISVGDSIILKNTNLNNLNAVVSVTIGIAADGTQEIYIQEGQTASEWYSSITINIIGGASLSKDFFQVSNTPDGLGTVLTLTQGNPIDTVVNGPQARSGFGVTGAGVTIGIISDSFASNAQAYQNDLASGALPGSVNILKDQSGSDEGRAMAEIIHAIAPGAAIDFYGPSGQSDMAAGIAALRQAGAQVIVDDLGYPITWTLDGHKYTVGAAEPQGGPLDVAIDNAVGGGAVYVTAGGNDQRTGYPIVYGHSADPLALTVAAMNWLAAPSENYLQTQTEAFSSYGLTPGKPNVTAPDGGPTSLPLANGLSPFFGTSAAAPATAAIAALMLQINPQLAAQPLLLDSLIEQTTTALGRRPILPGRVW